MDPTQLAELKQLILKKVSIYYNELGIIVDVSELNKHIHINNNELDTIINKKPKKPKIKFNLNKKNDYDKFIEICKLNNLDYFKFHDEHNWGGPAIKCPNSSLNVYKTYFDEINITLLEGTIFYIIHPKKSLTYTLIYPNNKINKINTRESLIPDDSDSESDNESESDSESDNRDSESESESEIETEEWVFKNTKYLIDDKNNIYSYHTNEFVGVKIDDYTIDFDSDEL
jgi:hypothetical protein